LILRPLLVPRSTPRFVVMAALASPYFPLRASAGLLHLPASDVFTGAFFFFLDGKRLILVGGRDRSLHLLRGFISFLPSLFCSALQSGCIFLSFSVHAWSQVIFKSADKTGHPLFPFPLFDVFYGALSPLSYRFSGTFSSLAVKYLACWSKSSPRSPLRRTSKKAPCFLLLSPSFLVHELGIHLRAPPSVWWLGKGLAVLPPLIVSGRHLRSFAPPVFLATVVHVVEVTPLSVLRPQNLPTGSRTFFLFSRGRGLAGISWLSPAS